MLLCCFSRTAALSKVIHVLQHVYCPIYFAPSCFCLRWVSFIGFEPVFGIEEGIYFHQFCVLFKSSLEAVAEFEFLTPSPP